MPCIYCDSTYHKSKKCNVYVSKEFRQHIALKKKCCGFSLRPDSHATWCYNYIHNLKCYICFIKEDHHMLDCPLKITEPKWFLPKIDEILLLRFFKLFDNIELFSFVRYCREALNYANLEPFKIMNHFHEKIFEEQKDSIIVLRCDIENIVHIQMKKIFSSKNIFLKVKTLRYWYDDECSAEDLFRHISPMTKVFGLQKIKMTSKVELYDILITLPNLNEIILVDTNIKIPNDWPQILLKYCKQTMGKIAIRIDDFNFNIDDLVNIMTTKSTENIGICLQIEKPNDHDKKWLEFQQKLLSKHFIQIKERDPELPRLSFFYLDPLDTTEPIFLAFFTLKTYQDKVKEGNLYFD